MSKYKKLMPKSELLISILQVYQNLNSQLRAYLKPYGITLQQYNVLKILQGAKQPLTTSVIRERMIEPMADTSRLVERLSAKGLVYRNTCCGDKRLVDVTISNEGSTFLEKMPDIDKVLNRVFGNIDFDETKRLNSLLDKQRG